MNNFLDWSLFNKLWEGYKIHDVGVDHANLLVHSHWLFP